MSDYDREYILMDLMVRITALEKILISKNIITEPEIQKEINKISSVISDSIIEELNNISNEDENPELDNWVQDILDFNKNKE
jgi:Mn-dependent DtxR family transcriptional regulator